jgi:hypothetical protein
METETKKSLDERVSYHESPAYAVAEKLLRKGYKISYANGTITNHPSNDCVGIFKRRDPDPIEGFEQRAMFIGAIWFENEKRNAIPDKNWVLEAYSRKHIPELTKLVTELSEPYKVKVEIRLESEYPDDEIWPSDLCT